MYFIRNVFPLKRAAYLFADVLEEVLEERFVKEKMWRGRR